MGNTSPLNGLGSGGAFFGHGAQGFGGVLAAAAEQPGGLLGLQLLGQRAVGAVADQALGLGEGEGRAGGQARGEFADLGLQLVIGDHFADQAGVQRALGVPQFVEEQQALGRFAADQPRQVPAGAGIRAVGHAGVAGLEARRGAGDAEVAAQGQVHAGADGGAVDRGDGRLVQAVQAGHQGVGGFGPAVGFQLAARFGLGPFGEVGAGAEAAALAGQHDDAHGRVDGVGVEQRVQVLQRGNVQRVALFGAVQGDPGDAVLDPAERGCVSHAGLVVVVA